MNSLLGSDRVLSYNRHRTLPVLGVRRDGYDDGLSRKPCWIVVCVALTLYTRLLIGLHTIRMEAAVSLLDILNAGLISVPCHIRADLGEKEVRATILPDGNIGLEGVSYPSLHAAMGAIPHDKESTSDEWQFWCWYSEERQAWTPLEHARAKVASSDIQSELRTSDSHPLRIDFVEYPKSDGRIGLTFCPGKKCEGLYGGTWDRDVEKDLHVVASWGATTLISLMEDHEFPLIGVDHYPEHFSQQPFNWFHFPIQDMQPPNEEFEAQWNSHGANIHDELSQGNSIVIHCRGGLGRTGLLAARILVEAGIEPSVAVAKVRDARKHSIETYAQEHYVLKTLWKNSK